MQNIPGFYGKFPELGDFVNRRMPAEFIEPWDDWLQNALATSREQLGSAWMNHYLTSPIWRFVLSKDLINDSAWIGLMMPSVDRVGRYFPLTLACRLDTKMNPVDALTLGSGWFDLGSQTLLSVLEEKRFDMEQFDGQVTGLGNLEDILFRSQEYEESGFGTAWQIAMQGDDVQQPLSALLNQLLQQRLGAFSLWWVSKAQVQEPSLLVCADLPAVSDYASMLNGHWDSGSWEQWRMANTQTASADSFG